MVTKLPKDVFYPINDPANLYDDMVRDVELLYRQPAFTSCLTLIVCFIDALAAEGGAADKAKFIAFMQQHFPDLCKGITAAVPEKPGAVTFYEQFRNGLVHLRGPKSRCALARDDEVGGKYVDVVDVNEHGRYIAINIDRLYQEFIDLVRKIRSGAT